MSRDADALYRVSGPKLKRLAYRYTGSVSDAEDVVQEAFAKLAAQGEIANPPAWLAKVVTNACLDRLRADKRRREAYVGLCLPEPASGTEFDAGDDEIDISFAVMRTLEALTAAERAALFMHDLFDLPFEEIATLLRRSPEACRQLASRARRAVRSGRKRRNATAADLERLVEAVSAAARDGPGPLVQLLSAEAELVSDGGGKAAAARNVIAGADAVARFLLGVVRKNVVGEVGLGFAAVNGGVGLLVRVDTKLDSVIAADLDENGRIETIYIQRNPDKLRHMQAQRTTSRPDQAASARTW